MDISPKLISTTISLDGKEIGYTLIKHICIYNLDNSTLSLNMFVEDKFIYISAFSNDFNKIAIVSNTSYPKKISSRQVTVFSRNKNEQTFEMTFNRDILNVAIHGDIVICCFENNIEVWNTKAFMLVHRFESVPSIFAPLSISDDGSSLACVSYRQGTAAVHKGLCALVQTKELKGCTKEIICASFSKDARRVIIASTEGPLRIFDTKTGKLVTDIQVESNLISSLCLSNDSSKCGYIFSDNFIIIDLVTKSKLLHKKLNISNIVSMRWIDSNIICCSLNGTAWIYNIESNIDKFLTFDKS